MMSLKNTGITNTTFNAKINKSRKKYLILLT